NQCGRTDAIGRLAEQDFLLPWTQPADHRLRLAKYLLEVIHVRVVARNKTRRSELDRFLVADKQQQGHRIGAETVTQLVLQAVQQVRQFIGFENLQYQLVNAFDRGIIGARDFDQVNQLAFQRAVLLAQDFDLFLDQRYRIAGGM